VTLTGRIVNPKSNKVFLRYYNDYLSYEEITADSAILDEQGMFSLKFDWNIAYPAQFHHGDELTHLYLFPGDSLEIRLDAKNFDGSVHYIGKGSMVNNYIAKRNLTIPEQSTFDLYKKKENEFTRIIDSLYNVRINFFNDYFDKIPDKSHHINEYILFENAEIVYNWATQKNNYPFAHAFMNELKSPLELPESYYTYRKTANIHNEKAIKSNAYLDYLVSYVAGEIYKLQKLDTTMDNVSRKEDYIDKHFNGEEKDYLFAKWAYDLLTRTDDLANGKRIMNKYKVESKDKKYLGILDKALTFALRLSPGSPAPDFNFMDFNGKKVSLNNFIGKIVYLDFWASWCAPCRLEIPHAKKLEEQFKNKDVVFLGVSIDQNKESWMKVIRENDIKGVQVIIDSSTDIEKLYNIKGIPRYLIIDREGKIVSNNAKRPSGEVWKDLESLLKEK
jgi:thiol-disulfide isomerase/thioredoxin